MDLQPSENEALDTAAVLIKYFAESPKDLPNAIALPIVTAWKAREEKLEPGNFIVLLGGVQRPLRVSSI